MQRKTSADGHASVHLNNSDREALALALARAVDYYFLLADCCRSNGDIEGKMEYELRHMAKLDAGSDEGAPQ